MIRQGPSRELIWPWSILSKVRSRFATYLGQENICIWQNKMTIQKREMSHLPKSRKRTQSLCFTLLTTMNTTRYIISQISFTKDYASEINTEEARGGSRTPFITFPLAVFLKNLRWVITASDLGLLRIFISTMAGRVRSRYLRKSLGDSALGYCPY